jgi:hypothetical protein
VTAPITGTSSTSVGSAGSSAISPSKRQVLCLQQLGLALSPQRLGKFHQPPTAAPWESLANYAWNVALCEALYPLLHQVEVVLRNALDRAIAAAYPTGGVYTDVDSWMDSSACPLAPYARREVLKAKKKLLGWDETRQVFQRSAATIQHADLVAAVDFGFWTGLLHKSYLYQSRLDQRFWPHLLPTVFPSYGGAHDRALLGTASATANEVRKLRNRVFHHEPIWRRPNLLAERTQMLDLMEWSCPEAKRLVAALDRLPQVLSPVFRRQLRVTIYKATRS